MSAELRSAFEAYTRGVNAGPLVMMLPMLTARDVRELADAQEGWVDPINNLV